jgi:hypothetical protein
MNGSIKPLNAASETCNPISSNCVIWQGPDIKCLDLCKGDTISMVIFKLACLVCSLKDQLNVDDYDLTCLNLDDCDIPHTFKDFAQLVIDELCAIKEQLGLGEEIETGAEQLVTVAACFSGDLGPTATMSAYLMAVGTKVCEQELTIQNQQTAITQILARLDVLEA